MDTLNTKWKTRIYEALGKKYVKDAQRRYLRTGAGTHIYPFFRTMELRESLNLLKSKGKFTATKAGYSYSFKIIGKLGPTGTPSFGGYEDYADYINKNTIVKGYRGHAFNSLGVLITENINKWVGR